MLYKFKQQPKGNFHLCNLSCIQQQILRNSLTYKDWMPLTTTYLQCHPWLFYCTKLIKRSYSTNENDYKLLLICEQQLNVHNLFLVKKRPVVTNLLAPGLVSSVRNRLFTILIRYSCPGFTVSRTLLICSPLQIKQRFIS